MFSLYVTSAKPYKIIIYKEDYYIQNPMLNKSTYVEKFNNQKDLIAFLL